MNEHGTNNADGLTVLAIGGNLPGAYGSVISALEAASDRLAAAGLAPIRRSRWWRSAAWPDPGDPPFVNGVVLVRTSLAPFDVLGLLRAIEAEFGPREGARNSPRVLDLDLIAAGRAILNTPSLTLPHPRAAERYFVMGPLAEIAPDWRHPVLNQTASALAARATIGKDARPLEE